MKNQHYSRLQLVRLLMSRIVAWAGDQTTALRAPAVYILLWACFWNTFIFKLGGATQGPERWVKTIEAFEQEDAEAASLTGGVMFLGSSSIRMWRSLAEDFPRQEVWNRGFGGSPIFMALEDVLTRKIVRICAACVALSPPMTQTVCADIRAFFPLILR